ncbi:hypothetical protein [Chromohalobacter nigrandesensis]|uniref:hypothetical protein n=1 Tax=Chromohalobacter nigrandesensis TaxID=119863 RepID=UPI001FF4CF7E|nr:hypothetical protein [Chromohalobacter nigrandesensis]MCK0745083.1 hypothetical protein [Chromohalobacter nigrandesensis]
MYFVEWLMRRTLTASKKDITGFEGDMKEFEKATEKYGEQYRDMQERQVSDAPSDARSIYKMNDIYMDVRTFFDEWRGGVAGVVSSAFRPHCFSSFYSSRANRYFVYWCSL